MMLADRLLALAQRLLVPGSTADTNALISLSGIIVGKLLARKVMMAMTMTMMMMMMMMIMLLLLPLPLLLLLLFLLLLDLC